MIIDPEQITGKSEKDVIYYLLSNIVTEPREEFEGINKKKTHLKIIVVKSNNLRPGDLRDRLSQLYSEATNTFKEFMDDSSITITNVNPDIYHLRIKERNKPRKHDFVIIAEGDYWFIYTLALSELLPRTIRKILRYVPELEIIELTPGQVEMIAKGEDYQPFIKGFLAKYSTRYPTRNITVDVYGGNLDDLDRMRELYFVEPHSISFSIRHSPEVDGKIDSHGFYSLERIASGAESAAFDVIYSLKKYFKDINENTYEKVKNFDNTLTKIKNGIGLIINSECGFVFKIKPERFDTAAKDSINMDQFNERLIKYFKNIRKRYVFYSEKEYCHILLDKKTRNKLQIVINPINKSIVIYPFKNCVGTTVRDVVTRIAKKVEASIVQGELFCIT